MSETVSAQVSAVTIGTPASGEWRIAVKGEQRGPFTLDQLRAMTAEGRLPADTLVWRPGMVSWAPIDGVPELAAPVGLGTPAFTQDVSHPSSSTVTSGTNSTAPGAAPSDPSPSAPKESFWSLVRGWLTFDRKASAEAYRELKGHPVSQIVGGVFGLLFVLYWCARLAFILFGRK
jgi:hypothetical protein